METASFAGFIKILFYIILFYYAFKLIMRIVFPLLVKKAVQKAEENLRNHHQNHSVRDEFRSAKAESARPRETKKVGEYVDYEEIE